MRGSATYICRCGWSGLKPFVTELEKREYGILVKRYVTTCPECGKHPKEHKQAK